MQTYFTELDTSLNYQMCVFQSNAMQTACHVWGLLISVRAAETQRPSSTMATVCLSVQLATMQRDVNVQVGLSFI